MRPITYYQMANLSDEEVKEQFVVRMDEYDQVISEIERDRMTGSIQHYVFVGQRGSGKSTLLRRIQAEVNTSSKLAKRLIAINLSEEQAGIYRLCDLWDRVAQELTLQSVSVEEVSWEVYGNDMTAYAKALYLTIQKALKKHKKKLVLLLDNIDRIFETIKGDQKLFRELLINYKDVRIIGGSTRLSEHHWQYEEPFYEFFSIIRLEALTREELRELLEFWSEFFSEPSLKEFIERHPGRLESIRILSDGMPRTMLNLIELLIHEPDKKGYEYLRQIVDRATPIYQERLGILPPALQKVLLELSFFWDAVKVKELVAAVKMESKTVSAMLKQLVDMQIVEKLKGQGRNHMYRLKERFFNLWLLMTQGGPKQKNQVKWLTAFLETWYDEEGLKVYYKKLIGELAEMDVQKAWPMAKALVHSRYLSLDERDYLISEFSKISGTAHLKMSMPESSNEVFTEALLYAHGKNLEKAIETIESIEQNDFRKNLLLGLLSYQRSDFENALVEFSKAFELGVEIAELGIGVSYLGIGDTTTALAHFKNAVEKGVPLSELLMGRYYNSIHNTSKAGKYFSLFATKFYQAGHLDQIGVDAYIMVIEWWYALDEKSLLPFLDVAAVSGYPSALIDRLYVDYELRQRQLEIQNNDIELPALDYQIGLKDRCILLIMRLWKNEEISVDQTYSILEEAITQRETLMVNWLIKQLLLHYQVDLVRLLYENPKFGNKLMDIARTLFIASDLIESKDPSDEYEGKGYAPELKETTLNLISFIRYSRSKLYRKNESK